MKRNGTSTGHRQSQTLRFNLPIKTPLGFRCNKSELIKALFGYYSNPESLFPSLNRNLFLELANSQASAEDGDSSSKKLVLALYEALNSGDSDAVVKILAADLEWWFHGPPSHQFLMRMLTGDFADETFRFNPQSIASFGSTIIVEGCDAARAIAWVHAWTVADGIITQVREYFNTALTVTKIEDHNKTSGEISPVNSGTGRFPCVWESSVSGRVGKSVPGLVLAI